MNTGLLLSVCLSSVGCATAGSAWMAEPDRVDLWDDARPPERIPDDTAFSRRSNPPVTRRVLGSTPSDADAQRTQAGESSGPSSVVRARGVPEGRALGTFRNTYYDLPSEADFQGEPLALKDPRCKTIKAVPRGFYEAVCVQGSGTLTTGATVSFAKRDCDCADVCPRTNQKICFDKLDPKIYPWGRGATGRAITPLLSVAVDTQVIPLETPLYIPEFDGLPRNIERTATHDGCFIAQDRGVRVKGEHVDVFTGHAPLTALWNQLVPSNRGVTVVLDSPRCARAPARATESAPEPESAPLNASPKRTK